MPAFLAWPVLKAFFGGMFSKLWTWLCARSFWQLVSLGLAIFALVQHVEIIRAHSEAAKWQKQNAGLETQLKALTTKKDQQQIVTKDRIVTVTKTIHDADTQAKIIEQAPLPGNCKTPKEVLDADV